MKLVKRLKVFWLAGLISLVGCITITPKASIDLAYIPRRTDDEIMKNEIMTEFDLGLEAKLLEGKLKNTKIRIGGRQRTYTTPKNLFSFNTTRQEYDIYGNITYENFKFYIEHICAHPLKEKEFWIYDEKTGKEYIINHDSLTKIGFKFEF